jgi:hypothetical protein
MLMPQFSEAVSLAMPVTFGRGWQHDGRGSRRVSKTADAVRHVSWKGTLAMNDIAHGAMLSVKKCQ